MCSFTFYDAYIPVADKILESLSLILQKARAENRATSLLDARIAPDMLPLTFQVHKVTDAAEKLIARTSGTETEDFEDDLKTFDDLIARIEKVQGLLAKADKELINGRIDEIVPLGVGGGKFIHVPSQVHASVFALPNLFFHTVTAYNILRKEGVALGKMDYLSGFINSASS